MKALQLPGAFSFGARVAFCALIQPRHVVVRNLFECIERDDVVDIKIDAVRLHAIGNALQFLLILGVDVRPEHLARGLAKELPIALGG